MILWDAIDPAELTGYVRAALADQEQNRFTLSRFLPSRQVDDLLYRFNAGGGGLVEAATFRSFDSESPIGSRPDVVRVTGELPPISRKIRLGEYDSLRLRANASQAIRDQVFNDAARMALAIAARMELARGEALATGQVVLNENRVKATINFQRAGGHTVSTNTSWATTASADPVSDLLTWVDTYTSANGVAPDVLLTSSRVVGLMLRNEKIRAMAGTVLGTAGIVPRTSLDAILSSYGLPSIVVYDTKVSIDGSATRVIADDKVVLLPGSGSELGATLYGTTAESQEAGYNLAGSEPGVVAGAYKTDDPVAVWTKAAGIALPVLANPDLSFTADVIL
jgi:hypothetical protein